MLPVKTPVAKEGYPFIGFAALLTLVLAALGCVSGTVFALALTTFTLFFFRDPERFVPFEDDAVISPADGKIIIIKETYDHRFTEQKVRKISIFMNVFNVHVNRMPFAGEVQKIIYHPGKFYNADSSKAELENEYCAAIVATEKKKRFAVVQIAGLIARRIVCWLEPGDTPAKGVRFGLIRFGSRIDLYLPEEAEICVKKGEKVRAGETVIARIH